MKKKVLIGKSSRRMPWNCSKAAARAVTRLNGILGLSQGLLCQWEIRYQVNPSSQGLEQVKAEVRRLQKKRYPANGA